MVRWHNAFAQNGIVCETVRDTLRELATVAKEFLQAAIDMIEMTLTILGGGLAAWALRSLSIAEG